MQGDSPDSGEKWNAVTAGRTLNLWEPTFEKIMRSPVIGYGRFAINRTDLHPAILALEGSVPAHPHNAYLEVWLDSGILGMLIVVAVLVAIGMMALSLLRVRGDPLVEIVGGVGLVAIVNTMALSMSSNFLYPKESMLWLFCSCGLVIRVWTLRQGRAAWSTTISQPGMGDAHADYRSVPVQAHLI